jgi:phospholipid/cholesterol/gamma-HCH transport system substrate-binding protein
MEQPTPRVHYIHRMSYTRQERLVGAFVLIALAVIVSLIFVNSRFAHFFQSSVTYNAYLRSAEGITTDTMVKISGLEVGRVSDVVIAPDNRIHVSMDVQERYRDLVRTDSKAAISKLSVLGKATIELTAGSPHTPVLAPGSTIQVEEPMSMDQLIAELTPVMESVKKTLERVGQLADVIEPQRVAQSLRDLEATAGNMRTVTEHIAAGKGPMGTLLASPELENSLRDSMGAFQQVLADVRARLAEVEPVIRDAHGITRDTRQITDDLPELITRMRLLTEQTERTMESVMNIWPISSAAPPPGPTELETQQVR